MVKSASVKKKKVVKRTWRVRYLPALLAGLGLLGVAIFLYVNQVRNAVSPQALSKLPKDSAVAGVLRLDRFDLPTIKQLSVALAASPQTAPPVLDSLQQAGVSKEKLEDAFANHVAFAATNRGSVAILSIKSPTAFTELKQTMQSLAATTQTETRDGQDVTTFTLRNPATQVSAAVSGTELYLASNAALLREVRAQNDGFLNVPSFDGVAQQLPAGRDGYIFYQPSISKAALPANLPLTGLALTNQPSQIKIDLATSETTPVNSPISSTKGQLQPSLQYASGSVSGTNISQWLQVVENQRQETDVPKVIGLQNGLASLSRSLGADFQRTFLAPATGQFVYGRYSADNQQQWMALLEYASAEEASSKLSQFVSLAQSKLTIPVRKQVVTTLPDGTQSREIVSETREPLSFSDADAAGTAVKSAILPGNFGPLLVTTNGKYIIMASSADAVKRMISSIQNPVPVKEQGDLAVRVKVADLRNLISDQDQLSDWVFAVRPSSGKLTLLRSSGELFGVLNVGKP